MHTIVFGGTGRLGRAISAALEERGQTVTRLGRPSGARHEAATLPMAEVTVEASVAGAVATNVEAALDAGIRRFVLATSGWEADRARVETALSAHSATAIIAPNLSLGAALFLRLSEIAAGWYGALPGFDPFLLEWHRRGKADRPSGTAREIARRVMEQRPGTTTDLEVVSIRAGASPGMHVLGFDAAGETVELRLTARDRSAYAAGALAAIDWLLGPHAVPGIHPFDVVVDALVAPAARAAPAAPATAAPSLVGSAA